MRRKVVSGLPGMNGKVFDVSSRTRPFLDPAESLLASVRHCIPPKVRNELRERYEREHPGWMPDVISLG